MKNNYTFKTLIALITCVLFTLQTEAQIRIVTVNPAAKIVSVKNFDPPGNPIEISGWWLCNFPDYVSIGSQSTSGSTNLNGGDSITITITSASFAMNIGDDEMGLYNSPSFGDSNAMEDYMQWGSAGHVREMVAVAAGLWIFNEFVNVTPPYRYNGDIDDVGAAFWETSLSVNNLELANEFTLSPNPTKSDLNLRFNSTISEGSIDVHDISGKLIYSRKIENSNFETVNASEWMQGIYLVTISTQSKTQTKRFVKQ